MTTIQLITGRSRSAAKGDSEGEGDGVGRCMRCPRGQYTSEYDSSSCRDEPAGSSRFARFCPAGSSARKNSYGRFVCTMCPAGESTK